MTPEDLGEVARAEAKGIRERRRATGRREHDDLAATERAFIDRLDRVRRLLHITLSLCVALFVLLAVAVGVTFLVVEGDRVRRRTELAVAVARSNELSACVLLDFARGRRANGDEDGAARLEDQARRFVGSAAFPPQCPPAPRRAPQPPPFPPRIP